MARVLAIDDEFYFLNVLKRFLQSSGYETKISSNGKDAIELFANENNFDVVVTDIRMPGMDGNEVARKIRCSHKPSTPIVAITATPDADIDKDLFDHILEKPFEMRCLVDLISSCL